MDNPTGARAADVRRPHTPGAGRLAAVAGRIVVGTSSWADPGFVEDWYPSGMPARERLPWYATHFTGVEVNSTFYAVPARRAVEGWVAATPSGFTFDVKLHRVLSRHAAGPDSLPPDLRELAPTTERGRVRLTDELEAALADRVLAEVEPLREAGKLSSFLLQLSPAFEPRKHSLDELARLIERLAPTPVAVEFRHRFWVHERRREDVLAWLEQHGAAFVCVDAPAGDQLTIMPALDVVTSPRLAYLRAHGRNREGYVSGKSVAERFGYVYSDDELEEIGGRAGGLAEEADEVRLMFNNNRSDDAPQAAARIRALLGQVTADA
jgi:uncharacterized protein YecE (DUF72 family)